MNDQIGGAVVDWLEEIPLEELSNETAQKIVEDFRAGSISVSDAIACLQEDCASDLRSYVNENRKLEELLKDIQEED